MCSRFEWDDEMGVSRVQFEDLIGGEGEFLSWIRAEFCRAQRFGVQTGPIFRKARGETC